MTLTRSARTTWPTSVDARIRPRHAARSIALVRAGGAAVPVGTGSTPSPRHCASSTPDADDEELSSWRRKRPRRRPLWLP